MSMVKGVRRKGESLRIAIYDMITKNEKHYCDLCGRKVKPTSGTFGDSYFRPIHFWGSLFKTTYILKYRLGDLYQELCQPCTNAFTKLIKQRAMSQKPVGK